MKRILASICALAVVLTGSLALVGCKDKKHTGTYKLDYLEVMGLRGSREALSEYKDDVASLEDTGMEEFMYIYDIVLNMKIVINKNNTGYLLLENYSAIFGDNLSDIADGLSSEGFVDGKDIKVGFAYKKSGKYLTFSITIDGVTYTEGFAGLFSEFTDGMVGITDETLKAKYDDKGHLIITLHMISTKDEGKTIDDEEFTPFVNTDIVLTLGKI